MALNPNSIDVYVGKRLRLRRTLLGMSQKKLGKEINLTFQQIQKYERGVNRIGSGRLYTLSQALNIPVSYFFDDLPPEICGTKTDSLAGANLSAYGEDPLVKRETLELVHGLL